MMKRNRTERAVENLKLATRALFREERRQAMYCDTAYCFVIKFWKPIRALPNTENILQIVVEIQEETNRNRPKR